MVAVEKEPPPPAVPSATITTDAIPLALRRRGCSPGQVLALTLVGALVLAVFASRDLSTWLDRLGGGPLLEPLQQAAAQWDGAMDRLGLTHPHDALRAAIRRLLDWQWGSPP
jgi:hypothetical protein